MDFIDKILCVAIGVAVLTIDILAFPSITPNEDQLRGDGAVSVCERLVSCDLTCNKVHPRDNEEAWGLCKEACSVGYYTCMNIVKYYRGIK